MANETLNTFMDSVGDDPTVVVNQPDQNQVEPLAGPIDVDSLMMRFPETVYDQSRDSHLFGFITALCGDAGVGLIKKQSYISRLKNESETLTFKDLDTFYVQNFRFRRLKSEIYTEDPDVDTLTPPEWAAIEAMDNNYKHRVKLFFQGVRLGNSPEGIETVAQSATGIHVETVENFKGIFDRISDDILNITIQGQTASPHEFILTPRVVEDGVVNSDVAYTSTLSKVYDPIGNTTTWDKVTAVPSLNPDIERNMIDLLDRVRPVGTLMTVHNRDVHFKNVHIDSVDSSSELVRMSRFVTGKQNVDWPETDPGQGFFVIAGEEAEAPYMPYGGMPLPTTYKSVTNVIAYNENALNDPTYDTPAFTDTSSGIPPYQHYKSEHVGKYYPHISQIYTFLKQVPDGFVFSADKALSVQNTPLLVEGRVKNGNRPTR